MKALITKLQAARAAQKATLHEAWLRGRAAAYGLDPDAAVEWFEGKREGRIPPASPSSGGELPRFEFPEEGLPRL